MKKIIMKGGSTELIIGIVLVFVIIGIAVYFVAGGPPKPCPVDETGQSALTEDCDCSGNECSEDNYCYDNECKASSKDLCNPDPCNGHGASCTDGICVCTSGFSGTNCETALEPCTDENDCNGNGVAAGFAGNCSCECNATHTGTTCEHESSINLESSPCNTGTSRTCRSFQRRGSDVEAGDETSWACSRNYYLTHLDTGEIDCKGCPDGSGTVLQDPRGATSPSHCICNDGKYLKERDDGSFSCERCGTGKTKDPTLFTGTVEDCMCDVSENYYDTGSTCLLCGAGKIYSSSVKDCICDEPMYTMQDGECKMDRSCMEEEATGWVPKCGFLKGRDVGEITFENIHDSFKTAFTDQDGGVDSSKITKYENWLGSVCTPSASGASASGTCRCPDVGLDGTCSACDNENDTLMNNPDGTFTCVLNPCIAGGQEPNIIGLGCLDPDARRNFITKDADNNITFTNSYGQGISGQDAENLLGELCPEQQGGGQTDRCGTGTGNYCSPLNIPYVSQGGGQEAGAGVCTTEMPVLIKSRTEGVQACSDTLTDGECQRRYQLDGPWLCGWGTSQTSGGQEVCYANTDPSGACTLETGPTTPSCGDRTAVSDCTINSTDGTPVEESECIGTYHLNPDGHGARLCMWSSPGQTGSAGVCMPEGAVDESAQGQCTPEQPANEFFQEDSGKCDCIIADTDRTSSGSGSGKLCNSTACMGEGGRNPHCQGTAGGRANLVETDDHPHGCDISTGTPTCICADGFIQDDGGQCLVPAVDCGDAGNDANWKQNEYNVWKNNTAPGGGAALKVDEDHNRSYQKNRPDGQGKMWVHECLNPDNVFNPFTRNKCKVNQFWNESGGTCTAYYDTMCAEEWDRVNHIGKYLEESPRCSFSGVDGGLIPQSGNVNAASSACCKPCDRDGIMNPILKEASVTAVRSTPVGDQGFPGYNSRPGNYGAGANCDTETGCEDNEASITYRKNLFTCRQTVPPDQGISYYEGAGDWGGEPTMTSAGDRLMPENTKARAWFDIEEPTMHTHTDSGVSSDRFAPSFGHLPGTAATCIDEGTGPCESFPKIWRKKDDRYYTVRGSEYSDCTTEGNKNVSGWIGFNSSSEGDDGTRATNHWGPCKITRFRDSGNAQPPDQFCHGERGGAGSNKDTWDDLSNTNQKFNNCPPDPDDGGKDECYKCNFPV